MEVTSSTPLDRARVLVVLACAIVLGPRLLPAMVSLWPCARSDAVCQWDRGRKADLNHVQGRDLARLREVDPAWAERFLRERARSGPFRDWAQVEAAGGPGTRSLLQPYFHIHSPMQGRSG